jgi:hypothetical protein
MPVVPPKVKTCFPVKSISRNQQNVDATAALGTAGGNIVGVTADVRDSDAVGKAFDGAASQLGTVDG